MADEGRSAEEMAFHAAAREGKLAEYLEQNPESGNAILYRLISELVYKRLTQPAERVRGHRRCVVSVEHLEPECHDRHQDDVEAVRADLLRHACLQIANLPGWLVPRLRPVTIDAYRKRRGELGAQQRPRLPLPAWLDAALEGDPWLSALAVEILVWVGVPGLVPIGIWPLSAWTERHAEVTGAAERSEAQVAADVERVLSAMRTNPAWHAKYVERPLGRKQAPSAPQSRDGLGREHFLPLAHPDEIADARLAQLAADAIEAIEARVRDGEELNSAVLEVLGTVFRGGSGSSTDAMDDVPGHGVDAEERVAHLLADPETIDRIAQAMLKIINE